MLVVVVSDLPPKHVGMPRHCGCRRLRAPLTFGGAGSISGVRVDQRLSGTDTQDGYLVDASASAVTYALALTSQRPPPSALANETCVRDNHERPVIAPEWGLDRLLRTHGERAW